MKFSVFALVFASGIFCFHLVTDHRKQMKDAQDFENIKLLQRVKVTDACKQIEIYNMRFDKHEKLDICEK